MSWFDWLWCRALKNFKGENFQSLESADMAYLLMLNEYLDVEEFVNEAGAKEDARIRQAEADAARRKAGKR